MLICGVEKYLERYKTFLAHTFEMPKFFFNGWLGYVFFFFWNVIEIQVWAYMLADKHLQKPTKH